MASGMSALVTYSENQLREAELHPAYDSEFTLHFLSDAAPPSAIGVLGYVPGKHPERMTELVLVFARLDGMGTSAVPSGFPDLGVATVLEVARQYSAFAQGFQVPERTVLFALFSGGPTGGLGLHAYLARPAWPLDKTRSVIYVGLSETHVGAVEAALEPHGIPLIALPVPLARTAPGGGPLLTPLRQAVQDVVVMAERLNLLLLREALTSAPFAPVSPDTLRVPIGQF